MQLTSLSLALTRLWAPYSPGNLFSAGEQGAWYDPSDFNRYMSSLGSELVTNGDFTTDISGWISTGAGDTGSGAVDGQFVLQRSSTGGYFWVLSTVSGRTYKVAGQIRNINSTNARIRIVDSSTSGTTLAESPTVTTAQLTDSQLTFVAISSVTVIYLRQQDAGSCAFDNVSVRELTAISTATMFQDAAGATPVTAVEQPVGLLLDKSRGLVLGSELVTNGDFSQGSTGWTLGTNWTIGSGVLSGAVASSVFSSAAASISVVSGRSYQVTYTITAYTSGAVRANFTGGTSVNGVDRSSAGTFTEIITAAAGNNTVTLQARAAGFTGSIDNISVRELPGNHATQTTSTSRPVLSARVNLLTKTEQFDDAVWTKTGSTVTANAVIAPDGTATADKLVESSTIGGHQVALFIVPSSGAAYTTTIYAKMGERRYFLLYANNPGSGQFFDLQTGTKLGTFGTAPTSSSITDVGNGWYRCSVTTTTTSTAPTGVNFYISNDGTSLAYTGDGTSGLYIWGVDLRVANIGVNIPRYQRVNTATDYDTAGFPLYLRFDGVDDFLVTNSINFTATDKMTVFAGLRKLSDAAQMQIVELSATTSANNGSFAVGASALSGTRDTYTAASRGTTEQFVLPNGFAAPITNVLTGLNDISGDSAILRVNGTQAAINTADQGTGNYGSYPMYIGRRGGATLPFNGHLYSLIVRGAQSNAGQIGNTEQWVNSKTGAY